MKRLFLLIGIIMSITSYGQLYVGDVDLNVTVKTFELHVAKAGFSNKERLYIDYGQKKFREFDYDSDITTYGQFQAIYDSNKVKFKKGEFIRLMNYLDSQGWEQVSQRMISNHGNTIFSSSNDKSVITAILFRRKK